MICPRAPDADERTAPDIAPALFDVGRPLGAAPLVKQHALALLASPSTPPGALGARALWQAVETFGAPAAKKITNAHLVAAQAGDPSGRTNFLFALAANLVQKAPMVHGGTLRAVTELWLASVKAIDSTVLDTLAKPTREAEVAWPHVRRLLEHDPENGSVYRTELLPRSGSSPGRCSRSGDLLRSRGRDARGGGEELPRVPRDGEMRRRSPSPSRVSSDFVGAT